jgi:hypothetical protein
MPAPTRMIVVASLGFLSLSLCSCKTLYSDMYSYRPNRFVPSKEKGPELPPADKPRLGGEADAALGGAVPGGDAGLPGVPGLVPAADPAAPALPGIPGL